MKVNDPVIKPYYFEIDKRNLMLSRDYILKRKKDCPNGSYKEGDTYIKTERMHFDTEASLLRHSIRRILSDKEDIASFKDYFKQQKEISDKIINALKVLRGEV